MWGFGNSAGLKTISNYAQAKEKFNSTIPIRGRKKECRPLGQNRRYNGYTINKNMRVIDDGELGQWQETYSAQVYGKDMIEWKPDGTVSIKVGRWHGTIVQSVINYTLNNGVGVIESFNGKWYFQNGDGKSYFIPQTANQELIINTENSAVENPVQEHRRRVKRKAMNEVRKRHAKFIEYGTNMLKISETSFKYTDETINSLGDGIELVCNRWSDAAIIKANRSKFLAKVKSFEQSGDLTLAYDLASLMVKTVNYWGTSCTSEQFKKSFDEVLKYQFRNEVFESEPVEIGKAFYDRNAKYFY
jgi:hypothetical protein